MARSVISQAAYLDRATAVHNSKYSYNKLEFSGWLADIVATCPVHGDFTIQAGRHIHAKRGCTKCSGKYKPSVAEFIERSNVIHDNKYDYTKTVYVNNKTKVIVTCPEHGDFSVSPIKHSTESSATGCPKCANSTKGAYHKKDTIQFVSEATKVHGNVYDYSKVKYQRYHDKVEIVCSEHRSFFQTAGSHIHNKSGCPGCYEAQDVEGGYGATRFKNHPEIKELPGILYIIKCSSDEEEFVKIGITRKPLSQRFGGHARLPYSYEEVATKEGTIYELFLLEQKLKREHKGSKHRPKAKFCGHTECFAANAIDQLVDSIT